MFETIYLPSLRDKKRIVTTNVGMSRYRNFTGYTRSFPKRAYQSGITKINDMVQLSQPSVIAAAAPFSLPIRNASYNLNADPKHLYRTPRSGLLWRVVGKEGEDIQNDILNRPVTVKPGIDTQLRDDQRIYDDIANFIGQKWDAYLNDAIRTYRWIKRPYESDREYEESLHRAYDPERGESQRIAASIMHAIPKEIREPRLFTKYYEEAKQKLAQRLDNIWFTRRVDKNDRQDITNRHNAMRGGAHEIHNDMLNNYFANTRSLR